MLNLFFKDVRAGAVFLWAFVPLNAVAALQASRTGTAFFWANVVCAAFTLVALSMLEWKNDAEPFVHSLPVTRAMVVRGRYVTAAAIGVLTLLVAGTVGATRGIGLAVQGHAWPQWVTGDMALAFLLVHALVSAVYLPCHYRWGYGKGNVAAALIVAAGIIVASAAGPVVEGSAPAPGVGGGYARVPAGVIPGLVAGIVGRCGLAAGSAIVLGAAAMALWASSVVAVRAYRNREI
jgi:hypothetical protein